MAECRPVGRSINDLGDICARAVVKLDTAADADTLADVATIVRLVGGHLRLRLTDRSDAAHAKRVIPASAMALTAVDRHLKHLHLRDPGARNTVGRSLRLVTHVHRILAALPA